MSRAATGINLDGVGDADVVALHQAGRADLRRRCSSSAAAATTATGRISSPTPSPSRRRRRCSAAFLGQFYDDLPPPPLVLLSHEPAERGADRRGAGHQGRPQGASCTARSAARSRGGGACRHQCPRGAGAPHGRGHRPAGAAGRAWRRCSSCRPSPSASRSTTTATSRAPMPMGVMVVAGPAGFLKQAYRKFSIRGATSPRATTSRMMREVFDAPLRPRPARKTPDRESSGTWPDLVLIDGGPGQLDAARRYLRRARRRMTSRWSRSPRGRTATPAANGSTVPATRPASSRRATRCCTTCNACATRPTASPSPPTAPGGPRH